MSTPELTLHVVPLSHPCMTVEAALDMKGLDYERVELQPGKHPMQIAEIYGEGNVTVPGDEGRRRAVQRLAVDHGQDRGAGARPADVPGRQGRRRPRGRSLGRRGPPGRGPPPDLGSDPLPPRVRWGPTAAPARWIPPATDFAIKVAARVLEVPRDHRGAARRRHGADARPPEQGRRAGRRGHDRRRGSERSRPADRLVAADDADDRRRRRADARTARARSWHSASSPSTRGDIPAGAFPASWNPPRPRPGDTPGSQAGDRRLDRVEVLLQPVVPGDGDDLAALPCCRHPEGVALALDDQDRDLDRVELIHTALLGLSGRVDRECEAEHRGCVRRLGGAARDPGARRAPARDQGDPVQRPSAQVFDHRGPGRVELLRLGAGDLRPATL